MKNLRLLVTEGEVHDFMRDTWKTDIFRDSHTNRGFIHNLVDQYAKLPRIICESTSDYYERAHFSTWWNAIMLRDDYPNPVIADLYLAHELYHAGTMIYHAGLSPQAFIEKMEGNELGASVLSEIQIYFEMPRLRESSFSHPIYADRFLADPAMNTLWNNNRLLAIEKIKVLRRDIMIGHADADLDLSERWIRKFNQQNAIYAHIWSGRYDEIERHMEEFVDTAYRIGRREAIERHRDWLEAEAAKDTESGFHIPFFREANLAAPFYRENKKQYQAAMDAEAARLREHMVTDPSLQQEIVQRILARNLGDPVDRAVHTLGTLRLPGDKEVSLHIRHAVDAVIIDDFDHVVLITREHNPGAGLKAVPGIFLDCPNGPDSVENEVAAAFRAAATETGIGMHVLENAEVIPLGERSYARPFDIRAAWGDMPGSGIGIGDLFAISTRGFCLHVKGDLSQISTKAGLGAERVHVMNIESLRPDQFGIPDHLPMIQAASAAAAAMQPG